MDRFLESFQERSTPQKVLIIVGLTILSLLVLAILYLITAPPRSDTGQTQNNGRLPLAETCRSQPFPARIASKSGGYRTDDQSMGT